MVAVALAEHLRASPAVEVTLPWRDRKGAPTSAELVFTNGGAARARSAIDAAHAAPADSLRTGEVAR